MTRLDQHEFNNRIAAQRRLLHVVNRSRPWTEELAGLSVDAIDRWVRINTLTRDDDAVQILYEAGKQLQCLAAKSQEQLTTDYISISNLVMNLTAKLESLMRNQSAKR